MEKYNRISSIKRNTKETQVKLELNLDGTGKTKIDTGVGFFDHMLTLMAFHGKMDLEIQAVGDLYVCDHHLVEDVGISLGEAFSEAFGDKRGIERYGSSRLVTIRKSLLTFDGLYYVNTDLKFSGYAAYDVQWIRIERKWYYRHVLFDLINRISCGCYSKMFHVRLLIINTYMCYNCPNGRGKKHRNILAFIRPFFGKVSEKSF